MPPPSVVSSGWSFCSCRTAVVCAGMPRVLSAAASDVVAVVALMAAIDARGQTQLFTFSVVVHRH